MGTIDDRIAALETKLKQAKAAKQKNDALKRAQEAKRNRRDDTRRKILVGAVVLKETERDGGRIDKALLTQLLNLDLTRAHDRALFDLTPLPDNETVTHNDNDNKTLDTS